LRQTTAHPEPARVVTETWAWAGRFHPTDGPRSRRARSRGRYGIHVQRMTSNPFWEGLDWGKVEQTPPCSTFSPTFSTFSTVSTFQPFHQPFQPFNLSTFPTFQPFNLFNLSTFSTFPTFPTFQPFTQNLLLTSNQQFSTRSANTARPRDGLVFVLVDGLVCRGSARVCTWVDAIVQGLHGARTRASGGSKTADGSPPQGTHRSLPD
jgi:hypothetical protein